MNVEINPVPRGDRGALLLKLTWLTGAELTIVDEYLASATNVWVGKVDDNLCCILGVIAGTLVSDRAYVWFLATPEFDRYKFVWARRSREIIESLLGQYPILVGHCVKSNTSSRRWLRWLQAKFAEPIGEAIPFEIGA
jgi:hypothetical protein